MHNCGNFFPLQTLFSIQPEPHRVLETIRGVGDNSVPARYAVYNVMEFTSNKQTLNIEVKYSKELNTGHVLPPLLTARRFQTGWELDCLKSIEMLLTVCVFNM